MAEPLDGRDADLPDHAGSSGPLLLHRRLRVERAGMLVLGNRKLDPKTDYNGCVADSAAFAKKVHLLWIGVGTK